jgi:hypothetical protein
MLIVVACAIKNAIYSKWNKKKFHLEEGPFKKFTVNPTSN